MCQERAYSATSAIAGRADNAACDSGYSPVSHGTIVVLLNSLRLPPPANTKDCSNLRAHGIRLARPYFAAMLAVMEAMTSEAFLNCGLRSLMACRSAM